MEESIYTELIIKYLSGQITAAEEEKLQTWLAESSGNEESFKKMKKLWKAVGPSGQPEIPNIDEEWTKLEKRLRLNQTEKSASILNLDKKSQGRSMTPSASRWRTYYAAAAVFVALIGFSWWFGVFDSDLVRISTQNSQTSMVTLSDGSLVRLNNASKIVYPESFPDSIRHVQLIGEAYFDVAAESRPFVVFTENARIRVLGTEFNVWTRNEETRVIVKEGRVSFRSLQSDKTGLVLVENQMAVCKEDLEPVETQPANPNGLLGWLEGRIVFDETRLKEVVDELSRIYDVEIGLQNPELDSLSISGTFQKKPLEEILEAICLTLDLEYRFEAGRYVVGVGE